MLRPHKLVLASWWALCWTLLAGVVADRSGLRWWQPYGQVSTRGAFVTVTLAPPTDLLFVGASRTWSGIDPDQAISMISMMSAKEGSTPRARVLGMVHGSLRDTEAVLEDLWAAGRAPRVLALELAPEAFAETGLRRARHLRQFASLGSMPRKLLSIRSRDEAEAWLLGLLRGTRNLLWAGWEIVEPADHRAKNDLELGPHGSRWGAANPPPAEPFADLPGDARDARVRSRARTTRHYALQHFSLKGGDARSLGRILELCRSTSTPLVVFEMPVIPEYRALAYTGDVWTRYRGFVESWVQRNRLLWLPVDESLPLASEFVDPDHLGPEGARLMTQALMARGLASVVIEAIDSAVPEGR